MKNPQTISEVIENIEKEFPSLKGILEKAGNVGGVDVYFSFRDVIRHQIELLLETAPLEERKEYNEKRDYIKWLHFENGFNYCIKETKDWISNIKK